MDPEKTKCATPGCDHFILPATAARTGGRCMRCVNQEAQQQHAEFVRTHRRDVDPFAGLTDPVDIILTHHTPRKYDELVRYSAPPRPIAEYFAALSGAQAQRLIAAALNTEDANVAEDIARSLATMTSHDLSELQAAWIEAGELWPSVLFRGAPPAIRDEILRRLGALTSDWNDRISVKQALFALAWIGDKVVQRRFREWDVQPPPWGETLSLPPGSFAHAAGWELDAGRRRELCFPECWAIVPAPPASTMSAIVETFSPAAGNCPWCRRPLVNLIELDLCDPHFDSLEMTGVTLTVLTCEVCTAFATHIFAQLGDNGHGIWHPANGAPDHLPDDTSSWGASPWRDYRCEIVRRSSLTGSEYSSDIDGSQIGGLPGWVQDWAYPQCPDCRRTMTFLAQLDNSRFSGHEGVTYAFLCAGCRVTATCYQQT